ncbi:MAG: PspA/IM30 family protein [SAR202 cluster bacterium]|nr:PspA/IM30 family protein [SAR202 cluster bacterium]
MAGIFRRAKLKIKAGLNALVASAEDPREAFADASCRHQDLLDRVRQAQARITKSRKQLEVRTAEVRDRLPEMQESARQALLAGHKDRARLALHLRQMAAVEVRSLEQQVKDLTQEEGTIALVEQRLAAEIETFEARQVVLDAQYSSAEAQMHIREILGGVSEEFSDLSSVIEQAEERTEHMQARAFAVAQLIELGVLDLPVPYPGAIVGRHSDDDELASVVEEQMADLSREIGAT